MYMHACVSGLENEVVHILQGQGSNNFNHPSGNVFFLSQKGVVGMVAWFFIYNWHWHQAV